MSRYYVDSFAYDFDMFMPREKKQNNVVELDRKKAVSKQASSKRNRKHALNSGRLFSSLFVVVMLALIVGNIYLRVQVTEVTTQINRAQIENDKLISEKVSLEMKIENDIAYNNLEESAKALGMQKVEPYQMNYICSADDDVVEVDKGSGLKTAKTDEE